MLPVSGFLLFLLGLLSNSGGNIHAPSTNLVEGWSPIQVTNQETAQFNRQFFTFQVNAGYQEYALYRYNSYGWVAWQPYTYSWAIHPGTAINHLKVIRDKNGISLHINRVYVSSWYQPQEGEVKGVRLLAGSYSNIPNADTRFDNFKVGYFKPLTVNSALDHAGLVDPAIAWGKGGSQLKNSKDLFQQATGMCLGSICQFNVSGREKMGGLIKPDTSKTMVVMYPCSCCL